MKTKILAFLGVNYSVRVPDYSGMLSVKAGRPMVNWLSRLVIIGRGAINRSWVVVVIVFLSDCYRIRKAQGVPGLVKRLKTAQVLLMQALAGRRHAGAQLLGPGVSRTASGVPRLIPATHRVLLRQGHVPTARVWLSLLSLYRVLEFPGKVKLSTITAPGVIIPEVEVSTLRASFLKSWKLLRTQFGVQMAPTGGPWIPGLRASFFAILRSGPLSSQGLTSVNPWVVCASAHSMLRSKVFAEFNLLCDLFGSSAVKQLCYGIVQILSVCPDAEQLKLFGRVLKPKPIGRLGFKEEPAGKVRVFAMVDPFTQWLLRPVHDRLMEILKGIPQDGAFNQERPLLALLERCKAEGRVHMYSFDLSAATDRVPVSLQVMVLRDLIGQKGAEAWARFLTVREYLVPAHAQKRYGIEVNSVRYAVGQPMGAYSSWAMLSMIHHFLVQEAARRASPDYQNLWFPYYAVLGDDVVIADYKVAREYQRLMDVIGVEIGLAKSVLSRNGSCEFAKRFFWRYMDCSPVSLKELALISNPTTLLELLRKFSGRVPYRLSTALTLMGYGFRAKSRIHQEYRLLSRGLASALLMLTRPDGGLPWASPDWAHWFLTFGLNSRVIEPDRVDGLLLLIRDELVTKYRGLLEPAVAFRSWVQKWMILAVSGSRGPDILATTEAGFDRSIRKSFESAFLALAVGCLYTEMFSRQLSEIRELNSALKSFLAQFSSVGNPTKLASAINSLVAACLSAENLLSRLPRIPDVNRDATLTQIVRLKVDRLITFRLKLAKKQTRKPMK